jgi:hypothetical protein
VRPLLNYPLLREFHKYLILWKLKTQNRKTLKLLNPLKNQPLPLFSDILNNSMKRFFSHLHKMGKYPALKTHFLRKKILVSAYLFRNIP